MKHLYKGSDGYDMPESWCGHGEFDTSEDCNQVDCTECLKEASEYGKAAAERLAALATKEEK
jgi:hypothetical protein